MNYTKFIENRLKIINKDGVEVAFNENERHWQMQTGFINTMTEFNRIVVLKARQQGFSSVILAVFTCDFILKANSRSVIIADIADNAVELLDRVKSYIKVYEEITGIKVPLKYNSKYELYNEAINSRYTIGTADNTDFGRSKTISNLHMSEAAFYPNLEKLLASAGTAVVPTGRIIIETTANGFNYFKDYWDDTVSGDTGFKALFYKASTFYAQDFLMSEKKRLKRLYPQEYPESPQQAFLTSGDMYFNSDALAWYLENVKVKMEQNLLYV